MFETILECEELRQTAAGVQTGAATKLSRVWGSSAPLAAGAIGQLAARPVLFVAAHLDGADEVADDYEVLSGRRAQIFPAWEVDIGTEHINDEVAGERLRICNALLRRLTGQAAAAGEEPADFLVAPLMALLEPVPTPAALEKGRLTLRAGDEVSPETLLGWLVDGGFERVEQVDQQGEFAHRGGIVDIFPPGVPLAIRVEFFGDRIESIRRFDLDTQRSVEDVPSYDIPSLLAGRGGGETTSLLTYLPAETLVVLPEPAELRELAGEMHRRAVEGEGASRAGIHFREPAELLAEMERMARLEIHSFTPPAGEDSARAIDLGVRSLEKLAIDTQEALTELEALSKEADVRIYCENEAEAKRFGELIGSSHAGLAKRMTVAIGHVNSGFSWRSLRLVVVGHHEIFHRYAKVRRVRRMRTGRPIESLLDLRQGDYVVHVGHGIAKFEGLKQLVRDGRSEEYLTLRFAGSAILHVPASAIHLVQKYVGSRLRRPSLSTLGGTGWLKQKQRVAEAVHDLAAEMIRLQAMRQAMPGVSYPADTQWQRQFAGEFLYTETEDQLTTMGQLDKDMLAARPMDRLLCGDVGYGKTELAMRCAFRVAEAGRQVAVLVPTTVLADQHWRTFRERLADYPFTVEALSRFRTPLEQKQILRRLKDGQIDILIGTHRLLSSDVHFKDLGLVVVDEEQRFGVRHKEHLKEMRSTVDVLTMTATPIPRTLHMALLGLRDISSLTTPPMDRRAIHTEVCHFDAGLIRSAILRELNRQGQAFFVHNRVGSIYRVAKELQALVPEARLAIAHGQMGEGQLEEQMLRFVQGQIDVLVCTTIIESGLDIPTVNTILIDNADRMGLAELHQLRGRVGRYKHKAFCYLLLPEDRPVSTVAAKRLKAIEEFSDLGAGFQIAMRDLEIRGAGNILGSQQSGHIAAVGYELYCQILERAVRELRGQPAPVRREVHVDLGLDAYIPKSYIPSERQRMETYRRIVRCGDTSELKSLTEGLLDAYGPLPPQAQTVLDLAEIRIRAGASGVGSIILMEPDIVFGVHDMTAARGIFEGAPGTARMPDNQTVHWRLPPVMYQSANRINVLLRRLRQNTKGV